MRSARFTRCAPSDLSPPPLLPLILLVASLLCPALVGDIKKLLEQVAPAVREAIEGVPPVPGQTARASTTHSPCFSCSLRSPGGREGG